MTKTVMSLALFLLLFGCKQSAIESEPGDQVVGFLRIQDPATSCLRTSEASNLIFESQLEWEKFFSETSVCTEPDGSSMAAPIFNFDSHVMVVTMLAGDCAYSGCSGAHPIIEAVSMGDDGLIVHTREPLPEELQTCLACVQPHDLILLERSIAEGRSLGFAHREAPSRCGELPE